MNRTLAGRLFLTVNAAVVMLGGFFADMGPTHMRNPRWPPHAKFHNAQTIGLGALLGATSLWFTWRARRPADLAIAVGSGSAIYASWLFAALMPGTAWTDPEFLRDDQTLNRVPPQLYLAAGMTFILASGALAVTSGMTRNKRTLDLTFGRVTHSTCWRMSPASSLSG